MSIRSLALATLVAATVFATQGISTAQAQDPAAATRAQSSSANQGAMGAIESTRGNRRGRTSAASAAENLAAAQALSTATNANCQVTLATLLGDSTEGDAVYEVNCATGPGYVFTASTPPQAIDCVLLEHQLAAQAAAAPAAAAEPAPSRRLGRARPEVTYSGCKMPGNTDTQAVMKAYATAAGVPCQADQVAVVGGASNGGVVYEVGCPGADGYRIVSAPGGTWTKDTCIQIVTSNATCNFTTPDEQLATFKSWIAGTELATGCDATAMRYMGANPNGSFYEAKCAVGDGYIIRFDTAMAIQQTYACAIARPIGGGCTLTAVAAVEPEAAPAN